MINGDSHAKVRAPRSASQLMQSGKKEDSFWQKITGGSPKPDYSPVVDTIDLSVPRKLTAMRDFRGAFVYFEKTIEELNLIQ